MGLLLRFALFLQMISFFLECGWLLNHQWNADEKDETDEPEVGLEVEEEEEDVILVDEQTVRCP